MTYFLVGVFLWLLCGFISLPLGTLLWGEPKEEDIVVAVMFGILSLTVVLCCFVSRVAFRKCIHHLVRFCLFVAVKTEKYR